MTFLDGFGEDNELIQKANKHWRDVARYEYSVAPLIILISDINWAKLMSLHRSLWQQEGARAITTRKLNYGRYCWGGRYFNPQTNSGRLIQRYSLVKGKICRLSLPISLPSEYAQRHFNQGREAQAEMYAQESKQKKQAAPNERKYLAERLRDIAEDLARKYHPLIYRQMRSTNSPVWEPSNELKYFLELGIPNPIIRYTNPFQLGVVQAKIDYFKICLQEFHEAEQPNPPTEETVKEVSNEYSTIPVKILLLGKYYPQLGKHLSVQNLPELAAEWYSDLAVLGVERIDHYTTAPYEAASNKEEFLYCLDILLTEAEKYSHLRGYGYRQHFAPSDLNASKEAQLEASGNAALRAVRNWHTEASLPPVERFVHRACKIELWQNEQHQLTTLGLDTEDWQEIYNKLFIGLRRAIYHTNESILRAAYTELSLLLPTLHINWMPQLDEVTDEEDTANNIFSPYDLANHLSFCEFVPLQPLSIVSTQRDVCLMAWLMTHINVKEWYVWKALILLAGVLKEPVPETPYSFKTQPSKPSDITVDQILTSELFSIPHARGLSYSAAERLAPLLLNYTEESLTALLVELGLLDAGTKQATPAASPGAWVGVIHALLGSQPPRLRGSKAAIQRAFHKAFGASVRERTVQAGLGTNGSEAEQFRDRTLALLHERTGAE